ncbi:hypothetical protein Tco_1167077 [Tanacetum coccineum]
MSESLPLLGEVTAKFLPVLCLLFLSSLPQSVPVLIIRPPLVSSIFLLLKSSILDSIRWYKTVGQCLTALLDGVWARSPECFDTAAWCGLSLICLVSSEDLNKLS